MFSFVFRCGGRLLVLNVVAKTLGLEWPFGGRELILYQASHNCTPFLFLTVFEVVGLLQRWRSSPEQMYVCVANSLSLRSFWCQVLDTHVPFDSFDFLGTSQGWFGPAVVSTVSSVHGFLSFPRAQ